MLNWFKWRKCEITNVKLEEYTAEGKKMRQRRISSNNMREIKGIFIFYTPYGGAAWKHKSAKRNPYLCQPFCYVAHEYKGSLEIHDIIVSSFTSITLFSIFILFKIPTFFHFRMSDPEKLQIIESIMSFFKRMHSRLWNLKSISRL